LLSNNRLATPSDDKILKIWNITDYKLVKTLNMKIVIDSDKNTFVTLSDDLLAGAGARDSAYQSIILIWNLTNYELVKEIGFKDKQIVSVTSLIYEYLVIGLNDNSINIININDYSLINQIQLESIPLEFAFLPNEDLVAITSNGNIYVFDLINNQIKTNFSTEITNIQSLEVINDKYIAVGQTGYLRIYDLFNQKIAIKKEFDRISSIKYIKNGDYLVNTNSENAKNIIVWKIFFENIQ
jgi:WD40 repeat protein